MIPARPRPVRPRSLGGRITLVSVLVLLVATAATVAVSTLFLRATLLGRLDRQLVAAGTRFTAIDDPDGDADDVVPGQAVGTLGVRVVDGRVTQAAIVGDDGRVRAAALDARDRRRLTGVVIGGAPRSLDLTDLDDYRVQAVRAGDGAVQVTGLPQEDVDATLERQALTEVVLCGAAIALGALGTRSLVRRTLRPLATVTATAHQVAEMPLTRAVPDLPSSPRSSHPSTEVDLLGGAFDRMLDHVRGALAARDATEDRLRRFVADAGHELRTPLATVRVNAALALRTRADAPAGADVAVRRIDDAAVRMSALVEDLLLLARLDADEPVRHEPFDLVRIVVEVVSEARPLAPDHRWRLDLPDRVVPVEGDAARVHRAVSNLVGNARLHTPPGTSVTVGVALGDGVARVVVGDDGPGIAEDVVPRVFDRFTRGDDGRSRPASGAGLGLAIARGIAQAHGGDVEVESRAGHTRFTLRLPAPDAVRSGDGR